MHLPSHALCTFCRTAYVAGPPTSHIGTTPYDISLPTETQLVLELKLWMLGRESFDVFAG